MISEHLRTYPKNQLLTLSFLPIASCARNISGFTTTTTINSMTTLIQVIHGRVRHFHHLFFNYRNIHSKLPTSNPERTLYAIRKEHLWNDWWTINTIFGEPIRYVSSWANDTNFRNITGIDLPVNREITGERREQLCKALEPEYAVYFQILRRAENIRQSDLDDARQIASANCPRLDFQRMLVS